MPDVAYPPLDTPKPFAEGVYLVDSVLPGVLGRILPARMTVLRLQSGELLLHSPTRFSADLLADLKELGTIRHLVAPNIAHWLFLGDWQRACPEATTWAAPGLRQRRQVRRSGVRLDQDLPGDAPAQWGTELQPVSLAGGLGFHEVALFHHPSGTLVLTDLVLNLQPEKLPGWVRPVARLFGVTAPDGMPPPYLRAVIKLRRSEAAGAAEAMLALAPQRVVFAHGQPFDRDGAAALRRSLRWLVR